ncbi:MAG: Sua5/YciO/YrdC/YwlC family protein [Bacteroidetes bacterium]|nr:Sua5/YciO/YrdC/YwlC family protein [Fibrella sp.]
MTPTIRDLTYQLRQGHLIAIADETGWSVAADPANDTAVRDLLALDRETTLLIDQVGQLSLYLTNVPEVAWDLVEFAENPLTVVFEGPKNLSPVLLVSASVAIRRALSPDIQRLIGSFGKGLLTVPFETATLLDEALAMVAGRFGSAPAKLQLPRILKLGVNGEIKFLRK